MKRFIKAWLDRSVPPVVAARPAPPALYPADELCTLPLPLPWEEARRVLVLAPHPDDEAIGCGGLIARLVQAGVPVRVVLVTDGSGAGGLPPEAVAIRQLEFRASLDCLGVQDRALLGFPDGGLLPNATLVDAVSEQVRLFQPDWLVGPSAADAHRDHRSTATAMRQAALAHGCVVRYLEYETWAALPATHVLDITDQLQQKVQALSAHVTALAQLDYCRAAVGLAHYRGLLLRHKREAPAGEAFVCTGRATGFGWPAGWGRPG